MKQPIILLTFLFLVSYATPQKTRYEFVPPASQAGQQCLQRCTVSLNQCKQRSAHVLNQCRVKASRQAKIELPVRVKVYEKNLAAWEAAMERYHRDHWLYEMRLRYHHITFKPSRHCRNAEGKEQKDCRRRYPRWRSSFWLDEPAYPGKAPKRPTLDSVTKELVKDDCAQVNQCDANYRACYTQCGGTVKAVND